MYQFKVSDLGYIENYGGTKGDRKVPHSEHHTLPTLPSGEKSTGDYFKGDWMDTE